LAPRRVFLIVLDSLGVGGLPDAASFGDTGAHTLDHIARSGRASHVPRLVRSASGTSPAYTRPARGATRGRLRAARRNVAGQGHLDRPLGDDGLPARRCSSPCSRTVSTGAHRRVGSRAPACRVCCATRRVGHGGDRALRRGARRDGQADRLHERRQRLPGRGARNALRPRAAAIAAARSRARSSTRPTALGRVIARPFVGEPGALQAHVQPPRLLARAVPMDTTLDRLEARAACPVVGVGKIEDIFAGAGLTRAVHTKGNRDGMERRSSREGRSRASCSSTSSTSTCCSATGATPAGYRRALEEFDADLRALRALLRPEDLVLLTADHGNDPTFTQTRTTRASTCPCSPPATACARRRRHATSDTRTPRFAGARRRRDGGGTATDSTT
jgi:phosphopentomutase